MDDQFCVSARSEIGCRGGGNVADKHPAIDRRVFSKISVMQQSAVASRGDCGPNALFNESFSANETSVLPAAVIRYAGETLLLIRKYITHRAARSQGIADRAAALVHFVFHRDISLSIPAATYWPPPHALHSLSRFFCGC